MSLPSLATEQLVRPAEQHRRGLARIRVGAAPVQRNAGKGVGDSVPPITSDSSCLGAGVRRTDDGNLRPTPLHAPLGTSVDGGPSPAMSRWASNAPLGLLRVHQDKRDSLTVTLLAP